MFPGSGWLFIAMLLVAGAVANGLVGFTEQRPPADVWSFGRRVSYTLITV